MNENNFRYPKIPKQKFSLFRGNVNMLKSIIFYLSSRHKNICIPFDFNIKTKDITASNLTLSLDFSDNYSELLLPEDFDFWGKLKDCLKTDSTYILIPF